MTQLDRIQDILRDILDHETLAISEATLLKQLEGWDSLAKVNFILAIHEEFETKLSMEQMNQIDSVQSVMALLGNDSQ